jgi:hypothetical protein
MLTFLRSLLRPARRKVPKDWDSTTILLSTEKNRERLEQAIQQAHATEPPQTVITFPEAVAR